MDGEVNFAVELDSKQAEAELEKLKRKIVDMEAEQAKNADALEPLKEQSRIIAATLDEAKAKLEAMKAAKLPKDEIADQAENVRVYQAQYNEVEGQIDRIERKMASTSDKLAEAKAQAGELAGNLAASSGSTSLMDEGLERVRLTIDMILHRAKNLAKRVFLFSLITRAFRGILNSVKAGLAANEEYAASLKKLKAAMLTFANPIIQAITPAVTKLIQLLTTLFALLANIVAVLFGKGLSDAAKSAEALEDEKKAIAGVGSAAKKSSKYLANFDEINQIGNSGGGGAAAGGADFQAIAQMQQKISELNAVVGGALLALGAILFFTGHPAIGAACLALGALMIATAVNEQWGGENERIRQALEAVLAIVMPFLFVIGVILMLTGQAPVGVGLMLIGVAGLATAASLRWGELDDEMQTALTTLMVICASALLAIGVILMLTGHIGIGLALTIAGALTMYQAAALNWDKLTGDLNTALSTILRVVGISIAVLGVVLLFMGGPNGIPIGIGMILAGITIFGVSAAIPQWDTLSRESQNVITDLLMLVGAFIAVLGIILLFSGALAPIGLGMIAAGVGIFGVGVVGANWGFMPAQIKQAWEDIKAYYNQHIKQYLSFEYWVQKGKDLIAGFKQGLSGFASAFSGIGAAIAGTLTGGSGGASVRSVPALAQGAVIPANRKFLAVLGDQKSGTNVEAPLATIEQAVANVFARQGYGTGNQAVVMEVDGQQFAKLIYQLGNRESQRVGVDILGGV